MNLLTNIYTFLITSVIVLSFNAIDAKNNVCYIGFNVENVEQNVQNYSVLVNAKKLLQFNDSLSTSRTDGTVSLDLPISSLFISDGNHSIAVYAFNSSLNLIDVQNHYISADDYHKCRHEVLDDLQELPFEERGHSIGVQYCVWHGAETHAMKLMQSRGGKVKTVETLIKLGESLDDYWMMNVTEADAMAGYYMVEPKEGYYCFYRKRPNENTSLVPDCDDIETTLARHAAQFTSSGVDYVYVDLTNGCVKSDGEDLTQRRPFEVLFEVWAGLRAQGKPTPQIVAWNNMEAPNCITWKDYLHLYNTYPDLVWKDWKTGKKVFMGTYASDPNVQKSIESNGGRNDVVVINNWTAHKPQAQAGRWQFMGWCGGETGVDTTDVITRDTCDQSVTRNSAIGDQISTGVSYQMDSEFESVPWTGSSSFYGLTFLMQWDTALRVNPQHITISGWNEFFAGPQPNPYGGFVHSIGLNPKDNRLFCDLYGAYRSRNIEPTVEYGNVFYDMMRSCLRVRRVNDYLGRKDCSIAQEVCCQMDRYKQFVQIHSMVRNDITGITDYMIAKGVEEREHLLSANYTEVCVVSVYTREYCHGSPTDPVVGVSGPFIMFDRDGPNRRALYRCKTGDKHFISTDDKCESKETDVLLGYLSTEKDSQFARSLASCVANDGVHYHALDEPCHGNDTMKGDVLGFVV